MARTPDRLAIKPRPTCGHTMLAECPLTSDDWAEVYDAWLAFRFHCALVSERAHARQAADHG